MGCLNANYGFSQFIDKFDYTVLPLDQKGIDGWACGTGDGNASMTINEGNSSMIINVDATKDKQGIWWAIIKHDVSKYLDLKKVSQPNYEIRIEASIKISHAPRRVNLSLNTQRTTDYHADLSEYYIPDTTEFHTISYTSKDFDAIPGDIVNAQLALMDWGLEKYEVIVDYFKVDVVDVNTALPDVGIKLPYRPAVANVATFAEHIALSNDAMINPQYPDYNFNLWYTIEKQNKVEIITVSDRQFAILRWDLSAYSGKEIISSGLLSLVTQSVQRSSDYNKDFGMIRVSEIIGGDQLWDQKTVTYNSFSKNQPLKNAINDQMIIDINVEENAGNINYITIPQPVMQRIIDGKTKGIALLPLGAVQASFFASEYNSKGAVAKLHFNCK
jgi:hypothetical protein